MLLPSGQVLIVGGSSTVQVQVGCCYQGQYLPHAELRFIASEGGTAEGYPAIAQELGWDDLFTEDW